MKGSPSRFPVYSIFFRFLTIQESFRFRKDSFWVMTMLTQYGLGVLEIYFCALGIIKRFAIFMPWTACGINTHSICTMYIVRGYAVPRGADGMAFTRG
jgi:hypothetical protein